MNLVKDLLSTSLDDFKAGLRGEIIFPDSDNYDEARSVYNGMIDKRPGMLVMCCDVADVIAAVNFGRENDLLVAVRGGGHNGGGLGICDEGMVIDLSGLKYVRVDTQEQTVRVGAGNVWGEVDHATHPFGLVVPAGIVSSTGVAGLTLGGGVGHLSRKFGLTIDNVLEVDMVLADGSCVTVNKDSHPDLYWAIRGGGGNFGIVTSFKFKAHPLSTVIGGPTLWPIEESEKVQTWYHNFIHNAPEDLNGFLSIMSIPPDSPFPEHLWNEKFCGIVWCYTGDPAKFDEMFAAARALEPCFEHVGPMPYPAIQSMFDGLLPKGLQWYWRADFFGELNAEMRKINKEFGKAIPTPLSQMHMYPISGAASRPGASDTPWAYRHAKYAGVMVGIDPDPANAEIITEWSKSYWDAMHPHSSGGAYSNFMMDEGLDRVKASFAHNYERLAEIKTKYDPNNLFRVNQNIKPA